VKTTVASGGQIVIPDELRQQDGIEAAQEFDIERRHSGEYLLQRRSLYSLGVHLPAANGISKWVSGHTSQSVCP